MGQTQDRVLAQRWRLLSELGRGGMGSVWRAEHLELGTPAAVKLIDPSIASSSDALARFKREAQAAASLRSINVVHILDYGVDGGEPYIAMELLEGESLADRLERFGRLEPTYLGWVLSQVAKAVGRAHELGIVHRDLKPENIYLARDGADEVVKVLDFGIAKAHNAMHLTGAPLTRTGAMLGTPYYMSPEQTSGQRTVDHRTDIWALAVIAFECLVGRRPFQGNTLGGLALAICTGPLPVPSQVGAVPAGFDEWFSRAAHREPDYRYASVAQAVADLRAVCGPGQGGIVRSGLPPAPSGPVVSAPVWQQTSSPSGATAAQTGPTEVRSASDGGGVLTGAPSSITVGGAATPSRLPLLLGVIGLLVTLGVGAVGAFWVFGGGAKTAASASAASAESALPVDADLSVAAQTADPAAPASGVAEPESSVADAAQANPPEEGEAAKSLHRSGRAAPKPGTEEVASSEQGAAVPAPPPAAAPARPPARPPGATPANPPTRHRPDTDSLEGRLAF